MTCFFCKGDIENGTTTFMTELNDCVIVIKNVPCLKCNQCGEVSYNGAVYERLEQIVDTLGDSVTEVAIVKYTSKAA